MVKENKKFFLKIISLFLLMLLMFICLNEVITFAQGDIREILNDPDVRNGYTTAQRSYPWIDLIRNVMWSILLFLSWIGDMIGDAVNMIFSKINLASLINNDKNFENIWINKSIKIGVIVFGISIAISGYLLAIKGYKKISETISRILVIGMLLVIAVPIVTQASNIGVEIVKSGFDKTGSKTLVESVINIEDSIVQNKKIYLTSYAKNDKKLIEILWNAPIAVENIKTDKLNNLKVTEDKCAEDKNELGSTPCDIRDHHLEYNVKDGKWHLVKIPSDPLGKMGVNSYTWHFDFWSTGTKMLLKDLLYLIVGISIIITFIFEFLIPFISFLFYFASKSKSAEEAIQSFWEIPEAIIAIIVQIITLKFIMVLFEVIEKQNNIAVLIVFGIALVIGLTKGSSWMDKQWGFNRSSNFKGAIGASMLGRGLKKTYDNKATRAVSKKAGNLARNTSSLMKNGTKERMGEKIAEGQKKYSDEMKNQAQLKSEENTKKNPTLEKNSSLEQEGNIKTPNNNLENNLENKKLDVDNLEGKAQNIVNSPKNLNSKKDEINERAEKRNSLESAKDLNSKTKEINNKMHKKIDSSPKSKGTQAINETRQERKDTSTSEGGNFTNETNQKIQERKERKPLNLKTSESTPNIQSSKKYKTKPNKTNIQSSKKYKVKPNKANIQSSKKYKVKPSTSNNENSLRRRKTNQETKLKKK